MLELGQDGRLAAAVQSVRLLWRPMAAWSALVWASGALALGPLAATMVGWQFGREGVVSNEAVLSWLLSPAGLGFLVVAGASGLTVASLHYAGLFHLVGDHHAGRAISLAVVATRTFRIVPALLRFSATLVALALLALAPLAAWVFFLYARFLGEYDINYYLSARPPEWYRALIFAVPFALVWLAGVAYVALRLLPAVPAFFDGHRPARRAARAAWRLTRGEAREMTTVMGAGVAVWLTARGVAASLLYAGSSAIADRMISSSWSLRPVLAVAASYAALSFAVDLTLTFLGFAVLSTVLTQFYLEASERRGGTVTEWTEVHATGVSRQPVVLAPRAARIARWLSGWRLATLVTAAVAWNAVASFAVLERLSGPPDVLVIAHRAGALHAPENTLLALDRAVAARSDFAEIDVQRTGDGVVVVNHDADLMRMARDPRRIADTDFAAFDGVRLGEDAASAPEERRLARLGEFLERARGRLKLAIELKYYGWDPELAPQVLAEVRAAGMEQDVLVISLSLQAIEQVSKLAPTVATGYLSSVSVGPIERLPVRVLAVSRQRATPAFIREARAGGQDVYVWTVNDAAGMTEMIGRGADGIITDDPALAARVRDELRSLTSAERLLLLFSDALTDAERADDESTVQ